MAATKQQSPTSILRTSIFTFLQHLQFFISTPSLLAFPFSASVLLSQSSLLQTNSVLGFQPSSQFLKITTLKLSHAILTIPFSLTFLLFAKASVYTFLKNRATPEIETVVSSSVFWPLLQTQIASSILLFAFSVSSSILLFISFNLFQFSDSSPVFLLLLISTPGAVVCSVAGELAAVVSGMERRGGFSLVLKAAAMIRRGRASSTSLSLALPLNLAMVVIEALFRYRIIRGYHCLETTSFQSLRVMLIIGLEGILICYMYPMVVVLNVIIGCFLFWSVKEEDIVLSK